jgi:parallel beta-helix repeat protein
MTFRILILYILFFAWCPFIQGTTYFVAASGGTEENNGLSATSPWKTLAKINSSKFAPGDTILLRRGSTWREQLNFPSSGSAGSPIVIDAYASGELPLISGADLMPAGAWSACNPCGTNIWAAPLKAKTNVVIFDGTKGNRKSSSTELSSPGDWFWDSGTLYVFSSGEPSATFQHPGIESGARPSGLNLTGVADVTVKNISTSGANAIPYGEGAGIFAITVHLEGPTPQNLILSHVIVSNGAGDGIHIENANHCSVDSVLVHDNEGAGIELYHSNGKFPITSGSITNSEIHHNGFNGIFLVGCPRGERCRSVVYPDGLTITNIQIAGNKVHDNGAGIYLHETNDSLISGNLAYSNTNTTRKGEGYCVGLSGSSGNIVEKNDCYKARLAGIELSIDTGRPPFGSSENIIRYNLVHDDGTHGIFTNYDPSQHNRILHNLIYNHPQGACVMANFIRHEIENNTCFNSRIGIHLYVSSTTRKTGSITVKNNIFVNSSLHHVLIEKGVEGPFDFSSNDYYPDGSAAFNWKGSPFNFAGWRDTSGQEARSILENPAFMASVPVRPLDFVLRPGSPALGKGADISWEIGANSAKYTADQRKQ